VIKKIFKNLNKLTMIIFSRSNWWYWS